MQRWPILSSEALESKALIPNFMKPTHKIEEKIDQKLRNQPLRGGKFLLRYINEQFLDDTNEKTYLLYKRV